MKKQSIFVGLLVFVLTAAVLLAQVTSGTFSAGTTVISTASLGTGAASSANYLRGDQTWAAPATGGPAAYGGSVNLSMASTTTPVYCPIMGGTGSTTSVTEANIQSYSTRPGTVTNFVYAFTFAILAGSNVVATIMTNGVATGITVTANANNTLFTDTAHSCVVTNFQRMSVRLTANWTGAQTFNSYYGFVIQ
jgi:hypothetical protein